MDSLSEGTIKLIVKSINDNYVVPVVGSNVFFFKEGSESVSVQSWVVSHLFKTVYKKECTPDDLEKFSNGYKGITHLERYHKNYVNANKKKGIAKLKICIAEIFTSDEFKNGIQIDPNVHKLLLNGHFKLILTTCCFDWSKIFHITCNKVNYEQVIYKKAQVEAQDIAILNYENIEKPTIFHLFGLLKSNNSSCVLQEDDFLLFLHCLHDKGSCPKNVKFYIEGNENFPGRNVLALGCTIPDWTFRFLLYSLKGTKYKDVSNDDDGDDFVGGFFDKSISNDIEEFLQHISYSYNDNPESLKCIADQLPPLEEKPKIFLSLCREEYDTIGKELVKKLSSKFVVWNFLENGDPYQYWGERSIQGGLKECKFIIPVITSKAIERIGQYKNEALNDINPGLLEEWERAIKNGNLCCPLYAKNLNKESLQNALKANPADTSSLYSFFFPDEEGAAGLNFESPVFTADTLYNHISKHT